MATTPKSSPTSPVKLTKPAATHIGSGINSKSDPINKHARRSQNQDRFEAVDSAKTKVAARQQSSLKADDDDGAATAGSLLPPHQRHPLPLPSSKYKLVIVAQDTEQKSTKATTKYLNAVTLQDAKDWHLYECLPADLRRAISVRALEDFPDLIRQDGKIRTVRSVLDQLSMIFPSDTLRELLGVAPHEVKVPAQTARVAVVPESDEVRAIVHEERMKGYQKARRVRSDGTSRGLIKSGYYAPGMRILIKYSNGHKLATITRVSLVFIFFQFDGAKKEHRTGLRAALPWIERVVDIPNNCGDGSGGGSGSGVGVGSGSGSGSESGSGSGSGSG